MDCSLIRGALYWPEHRALELSLINGRRYLYRPLVQREDYVEGESRRLMDRLFGGKLSPLVAHLAERDALSAQEIEEIEALLQALKQ